MNLDGPSLGLFLRINTHNSDLSKSCMDLLSSGDPSRPHVHRSQEVQHYPDTFKGKAPPLYNSGDIAISSPNPYSVQENPSKNRILRVFCEDISNADTVLKAFNSINTTSGQSEDPYNKPNFSKVIADRFIPDIQRSGTNSFILLSETQNPQIIVYSPDESKPYHWFAIHDDYTFFLVATQTDPIALQEYIFDTIPGAYIFSMGGLQSLHVAFHSIFVCQKYRRLERSTDRDAGKFRALAGVEEYLSRLANA